MLGSAAQYNGFFRYYPATKKVEYFGKHGPSQTCSVLDDGKVWFCGYPNVNLSAYDPSQPWTSRSADPLPPGRRSAATSPAAAFLPRAHGARLRLRGPGPRGGSGLEEPR